MKKFTGVLTFGIFIFIGLGLSRFLSPRYLYTDLHETPLSIQRQINVGMRVPTRNPHFSPEPPTTEPPTAQPPTTEPPTAQPPTTEPPTAQPLQTKSLPNNPQEQDPSDSIVTRRTFVPAELTPTKTFFVIELVTNTPDVTPVVEITVNPAPTEENDPSPENDMGKTGVRIVVIIVLFSLLWPVFVVFKRKV